MISFTFLPSKAMARELQAILTLYIGTLMGGYAMGWSAVAIPDMREEMRTNGSFYGIPRIMATTDELSWVVSSVNIGQILGSLIGGYCGGRLGPRRTILLSCILASIGWILIALSPHFTVLVIGRVLSGIGSSFSTANCSLLVAQYSTLRLRGAFLSLYGLMVGMGILLCYCLGACIYWRYVSLIPPALYLVLFSGLLLVPESPLWLLGHRGPTEAIRALEWLRHTKDVTQELGEIEEIMENQSRGLTLKEAIRNLARSDIRTPFLLVTANFYLVFLSGLGVVIFYSVEIFQNSGSQIDKHLAAIISASIRVAGGIVGIFLIQRLPRVRLNMLMSTVLSLSMAMLGLSSYLKDHFPLWHPKVVETVPVLTVSVFMFCSGAAVAPLLWVYLAELLPREYKVLSGLICSLGLLPVFLTTKIYPSLLSLLSPHGTYWLFAAIGLSSNVFYYFCMPETKGKSSIEVKQIFLKKN